MGSLVCLSVTVGDCLGANVSGPYATVTAHLGVDKACMLDAGVGVADPVPPATWVKQGRGRLD